MRIGRTKKIRPKTPVFHPFADEIWSCKTSKIFKIIINLIWVFFMNSKPTFHKTTKLVHSVNITHVTIVCINNATLTQVVCNQDLSAYHCQWRAEDPSLPNLWLRNQMILNKLSLPWDCKELQKHLWNNSWTNYAKLIQTNQHLFNQTCVPDQPTSDSSLWELTSRESWQMMDILGSISWLFDWRGSSETHALLLIHPSWV